MRKKLIEAQESNSIVRIERDGIEDGWIDGFILALDEEFFVVAEIDDRVAFNATALMRIRDVTSVKYSAMRESFFKWNLQRIKSPRPSWDISPITIRSVLQNHQDRKVACSIHLEQDDPEVFFVGIVVSVTKNEIVLRTINVDGEYSHRQTCRLGQITRIDSGGAYETALFFHAEEVEKKRLR